MLRDSLVNLRAALVQEGNDAGLLGVRRNWNSNVIQGVCRKIPLSFTDTPRQESKLLCVSATTKEIMELLQQYSNLLF